MSRTDRFTLAFAAHGAGRLDEAERGYRAVLAGDSRHADAWHLLGTIQHQRGRPDEAVESITRALKLTGPQVAYLTNLGVILASGARNAEAIAHLEQALAIEPNNATATFALASALHSAGRIKDAEQRYRAAIQLQPDNGAAYSNLGAVLKDQGRDDEAEAAYSRAIALNPAHARAHYNLGILFKDSQRLDAAAASFRKALAAHPNFAEAHVNLGAVLHDLGDLDGAIAHARKALELAPDDPGAHNNLGAALRDAGDIPGAMASYARALALQPDLAEARHNEGVALERTGQTEDALARYKLAQSLRPAFAEAWLNAALLMLMSGDFAHGWEAYETRWQAQAPRNFPQPAWQGEAGGKILVWGEQGLGDEILYAGMIPDLRARGHEVVIETDARLAPLFARAFGGIEVVARCDPPDARTTQPDIRWQTPLANLGRWLRPDVETFPKRTSYLCADAARSALYRARLTADAPRLVVGISWASANERIGKLKSLALAQWSGVLKIPGICFVDLQYGDTAAERARVEAALGVHITHFDDLDLRADVDGVAALAQACDLVISVSNTTVHLAAALGRPTWVLVPANAGNLWYWMRGADHTPWYPSVTIFRQAKPGDWQESLAAVERKLQNAVTAN